MTAAPAVRFDPFHGAYHDDPAGALSWARRDEPVFHSALIDHFVVTRYRDIRRVFGDCVAFSAGNALEPLDRPCRDALRTLARYGFQGGPILANEDEPVHGQRRRKLVRPLSRARVRGWEPYVRELVTVHIDRFIRDGHADLVDDLLWEVCGRVVFSFLGVPEDDLDEAMLYGMRQSLFAWGHPTEAEQVRMCDLMGRYWQFSGRLVERLRRDGRGHGWLPHAMRAARAHPDLFDDGYLRALLMNGSTAGHETTANAAANAVRTLLENPPAWQALASDPALVPAAVEECLRLRSPVVAWRRRAVRDVTVAEVRIPAGADVLLATGSGNHDAAVFADPERFDPYRGNAHRHLAFGFGNHACVGAPLARLQVRVVLEELTRRLPALRLAPGQDFAHIRNTSFNGPDHLYVQWDVA